MSPDQNFALVPTGFIKPFKTSTVKRFGTQLYFFLKTFARILGSVLAGLDQTNQTVSEHPYMLPRMKKHARQLPVVRLVAGRPLMSTDPSPV